MLSVEDGGVDMVSEGAPGVDMLSVDEGGGTVSAGALAGVDGGGSVVAPAAPGVAIWSGLGLLVSVCEEARSIDAKARTRMGKNFTEQDFLHPPIKNFNSPLSA
jgi:hypothetical protein